MRNPAFMWGALLFFRDGATFFRCSRDGFFFFTTCTSVERVQEVVIEAGFDINEENPEDQSEAGLDPKDQPRHPRHRASAKLGETSRTP